MIVTMQMVVAMVVEFASDIQCLCDEVVNHILDFGDTKEALEDNGRGVGRAVNKFRRCVDMCEKLIKSITTSSKFPCEWKKYKMVLFENCGEEGASEVFCVNEATGFSLICEYLGYFLVFVVGSFNSIRAIETKGGDDDRQWLTFWVIYFIFSMVERFSSVLLSRLPVYYEVKLLLVIWLFPPFYGARWCYVTIHRTFSTLRNHWLIRYALSSMLVRFYGMSKETAIEYVLRSRQEVKDQLLVQSFVENALDKASKDDRFDSRVLSEFEGLKNAYPSYWASLEHGLVLQGEAREVLEGTDLLIAATIEARQPVKSSQDKEAAEKYLEDLKRVIRVERSIGEALDLAHETVISRAKKMMESKIQELSLLPDSPCTEEGKNFPRMDSTAFGGYADPYVKLTLRNEYPLDEGGVGRSGLLKTQSGIRGWRLPWSRARYLPLLPMSEEVDYEGIWCNVAAPFHVLCVEVWDRDFPRFLNGERIASLEIPLARLMDGRSHMHCISFPWPESARHHSELRVFEQSNDDKGTISIKLQWIS
ncbi:hypothetical protein GUITHDRAFT_136174 [Guillardia theta CCMP2712]|uniref:Receptor expression-enhancing protein n=1 Tax=Guillardia theta (strain CCMP2712) TaxID=905079 RepID=L1JLE4_GUITC|nr:hypothetical protein GUITHDRAFT_136174 [Guillardia theta CCMP2712]EKX48974.1 hypothetical protein GUITHDRAFT_136174 [Guillardia theta CCMP2712]|eukprot:XP_005835954.1 hypothetical protein GUITHDRAFT_136174 [Guillardia theta CCMP2712]